MNIKRIISLFVCAFLAAGLVACNGEGEESSSKTENSTQQEERIMTDHAVYDAVALPDSLWQTPEYFYSEKDDREGDDRIKALYMRSDYDGAESYAFGYLGIPEGATAENKKPAVLLIHGGAGSAYWHWVQKWVDRGYVALALDYEGHVAQKTATMDSPYTELYVKSEYPAPSNQNFNDAAKPIEKTWMYYAVSTAVTGNSLLHSLPQADGNKTGVCGVSWGSVITAIITGYDDRFAFSVPIYCAVGLKDHYGLISDCYKNNPAALVWDDDGGIKKVNTPVYFVLPNNDFSMSPMPASVLCGACKNARVSYFDRMLHSQSIAAACGEVYDFADEIVSGKQQLIKIVSLPDKNASPVRAELAEGQKIDAATVFYGSDEPTVSMEWSRRRAQFTGNVITYSVPETAKYFYIKIEDNYGRVVTTPIVTL